MLRGNWQHRVERTIARRNEVKNDTGIHELIRFLDRIQEYQQQQKPPPPPPPDPLPDDLDDNVVGMTQPPSSIYLRSTVIGSVKRSEDLVRDSISPEVLSFDPDVMEMLYYVEVSLFIPTMPISTSSSSDNLTLFSDMFMNLLERRNIKYSNIVYVALYDTLIFDRLQNGLLFTNVQFFYDTIQRNKYHNENNNTNTSTNTNTTTTTVCKKDDRQQNSENDDNSKESTISLSSVAYMVQHLPGIVLDTIITYLPPAAIVSTSQVCRNWYNEIGKNSPYLWEHYLQQHNWPVPPPSSSYSSDRIHQQENDDDGDEVNPMSVPIPSLYRDAFVKHYGIVRDVKALKYGLEAITMTETTTSSSSSPLSFQNNYSTPPMNVGGDTNNISSQQQQQYEMSYEDFATRTFSPTYPNQCVSIQVWSTSRILAAYDQDCSLRLFEKNDSNHASTRELICQKIDPYYYTEKKDCIIVSMDLDEEYIGCLCYVQDNTENNESNDNNNILIMMSRDDFLLGESSSSGGGTRNIHNHNTIHRNQPDDMNSKLSHIDIKEAVLKYFIRTTDTTIKTDNATGEDLENENFNNDFIEYKIFEEIESMGGDFSTVEIDTSPSIIACGNGRFLIEVSIFFPLENHTNDETTQLWLSSREFVLFSASNGAIIWTGNSSVGIYDNDDYITRGDPFFSCRRRPDRHHHQPNVDGTATALSSSLSTTLSRCSSCWVVATSPVCESIRIFEIIPFGVIQTLQQIRLVAAFPPRLLTPEFDIDSEPHKKFTRYVILTMSDILVADSFIEESEIGQNNHGHDNNNNNINNNNNTIRRRFSELKLYPRSQLRRQTLGTDICTNVLQLPEGVEIIRMSCLRDDYAVILCRQYYEISTKEEQGDVINGDLDEQHQYLQQSMLNNNDDTNNEMIDPDEILNVIDGNRLVDPNDHTDMARLWMMQQQQNVNPYLPPLLPTPRIMAYILHVPSRRWIDQIKLLDSLNRHNRPVIFGNDNDIEDNISINDGHYHHPDVPLLVTDCDTTIGMALAWKGIILTGPDVRYQKQKEKQSSTTTKYEHRHY